MSIYTWNWLYHSCRIFCVFDVIKLCPNFVTYLLVSKALISYLVCENHEIARIIYNILLSNILN